MSDEVVTSELLDELRSGVPSWVEVSFDVRHFSRVFVRGEFCAGGLTVVLDGSVDVRDSGWREGLSGLVDRMLPIRGYLESDS